MRFRLGLTIILIAFPLATLAAAAPPGRGWYGRIVRPPKEKRYLWYVNPRNGHRYLIHDSASCLDVVGRLALGITDANLEKIPAARGNRRDAKLVSRLAGRFLLAVQQHGAAFYLNPADGLRYRLGDGPSCVAVLGRFGKELTLSNLARIPMNGEQVVFDPLFSQVAWAKLDRGKPPTGAYADQILPIASLTKLVTAMVVLDRQPNWAQTITVTQADLDYPQTFVDPGDITSEVAFAAGQQVTVRDLWTAMLLASSNQAAAMLAKHSGLPEPAFVSAMNAKARQLGLRRTAFTDPSGLDPFNVSTATEMAQLAAAAFSSESIANTSVLQAATITARWAEGIIQVPVVNRNRSVLNLDVEGAKTGYLTEAQRTVAVRKGDVVAVVLHARSMKERNRLLKELLKSP